MADLRTGIDEFLAEFGPGPRGEFVMIEDNGSTGYAYLLNAKREIVGDVWLYNRGAPPQVAPWRESKDPPFANPASFVENLENFVPPTNGDLFEVRWVEEADQQTNVLLLFDGAIFAVLAPGQRPGWSKLAKRDGPLARRLEARLR